jgi:tetratricopeptide (TPR) repeat protein
LICQLQPDARTRFAQAKQLLELGRYESAAVEFTELLKTAPDSPLLYNLLGFCYLKQNMLDTATENFEHAVALKPDFKAARNNLGGVYILKGKVQEAVNEFTAVVQIDPSDENVQKSIFDLAQTAFRKQDYGTTLKLLDLVKPAKLSEASWHEMKGYSSFKTGDPDRAVTEIQKAMDLDPRNEDYILELSEVFVANNNGRASVTLLNSARKLFVNSARLWFALGVSSLMEEDRQRAEAALRKSLELDPRLDQALVVLGQNYKEAGQWNDLLEASGRLIQLNPHNPAGYYYQAIALLHSSARDDDKIEALLRKSIALHAEDPGAQYELAKLMSEHGRKDEALRELEKLVAVNSDFGPAYYQLFRLYRERGDEQRSAEAQKAQERIRLAERERVTKKMLVEVRRRGGNL